MWLIFGELLKNVLIFERKMQQWGWSVANLCVSTSLVCTCVRRMLWGMLLNTLIWSVNVCEMLQKLLKRWAWNALRPPLKTNSLHSVAWNMEDAPRWITRGGCHRLSSKTCPAAAFLQPQRLKTRSEREESHWALNLTAGGSSRQTALRPWDSNLPSTPAAVTPTAALTILSNVGS